MSTDDISQRARACGKFLYAGAGKLWIRGVTYGTFRPGPDGAEFPDRHTVDSDLGAIADNGFNAIRTYTVPPPWLLDAAAERGLGVMAGVPWEQHVTFLDDRRRAREIVRRAAAGVRACAKHPALLAVAIGNEIPAPIVRWHGRRRVERHLAELHDAAKTEDPDALVTYVNYPTTEYLELPFLDFVTFNVYLEKPDRLAAYLARLQNLAGDRPLVIAEVGLDSRRHGEGGQAEALTWQTRTIFEAGCAGLFIFAWTDEWHRGGHDVDDWDFGLTGRDRRPKPALAAVRDALAAVPVAKQDAWPRISVVVCSYNGARTIRDCLDGLQQLEYPNYEVIVIDDGSTDATAEIARSYGVRVTSTPNHGLSHARNLGMRAATGEIVAYTDDDARPDPHWLTYVAAAFLRTDHAAVGGPNIPPPGDGPLAECVANAPGGPAHVLLSDAVAEHIPGCNMSFRKSALEAIGGFDHRFRAAGDDVDVCWRLQDAGHTIGFSAPAMVWHHRRNSLRMYWRQQIGYGKAEALLEQKWPEKYNAAGHITWSGRIYAQGLTRGLTRSRIYHGSWGMAPFQSLYETPLGDWASLPLMPEWYFLVLALLVTSGLGLLWTPLLGALPALALCVGATIVQAARSAAAVRFQTRYSRPERAGLRAIVFLLHLAQPLARLNGRLRHGLTLWRRRGQREIVPPWPRRVAVWSERWHPVERWLGTLERCIRETGAVALRGGDYDDWDLAIRGGSMGATRLVMAVEEHGVGRQYARFRTWPRATTVALVAMALLTGCAVLAARDGAPAAAVVLGVIGAGIGLRVITDCGRASAALAAALGALPERMS